MSSGAEDKIEMISKFPITILLVLFVSGAIASAEQAVVTVEKGDTLYSIGRDYEVSVEELIEANGILNPEQLRSGTEIVVPHTHKIEKGETLYGISREYGLSVSELAEYNDIDKDKPIKIGQAITIPPEYRTQDSDGETKLAQENGESSDGGDEREDESSSDSTEDRTNEGRTVEDSKSDRGDEKEETRSDSVQEVGYDRDSEGVSVMWPHTGDRMELSGKLKGTQIDGEAGDRVVAVSSGKVVWVAPYRGYGELVMVENSNGHIYAYGGNEETFVEVGERISAGTVIGRLGVNPVERSAKVFFFVYRDGTPVDPEKAPRG
ncbi:MAG: LysM peptidoglycan-binding domain-containing M23 family metallopeptidase [Spirochaetia bacterium]